MTTKKRDSIRRPTAKRVATIVSAIGAGALALALGLAIRPWFTETPAEAVERVGSDAEGPAAEGAADSAGDSHPAASPASSDAMAHTAGGIQMTATNFRREADRVLADICFDRPDASDWTIWTATFEARRTVTSEFGFFPIELRDPEIGGRQQVITFNGSRHTVTHENASLGARGRRCDSLYFDLPAGIDLSSFTITIGAIAAAPREGEVCTPGYLRRVQEALDRRITGIRVDCVQQELASGMVEGLRVVSSTPSLSIEEAETLLGSQDLFIELHGIEGPWRFTTGL